MEFKKLDALTIFYYIICSTFIIFFVFIISTRFENISTWIPVFTTAILAEITAIYAYDTHRLAQETKNQSSFKRLDIIQHKIKIIKGFFIDIKSLENDFLLISKDFIIEEPVTEKSEKWSLIHKISMPICFYPEYGVYYSSSDEIFSLDSQLAIDLFVFYGHLLYLEKNRKILQTGQFIEETDGINIRLNFICKTMSDQIPDLRKNFPIILEKLKNEVIKLEEEEKLLQNLLNLTL